MIISAINFYKKKFEIYFYYKIIQKSYKIKYYLNTI